MKLNYVFMILRIYELKKKLIQLNDFNIEKKTELKEFMLNLKVRS